MPNLSNLTKLEEDVVAEYIIDLVERGFPSRLVEVADIANSLRAERNIGYISLNWPSTFVKRRSNLRMKFNYKYDYKRAFCEDSDNIRVWFKLVGNTKAKYSILDNDI
jgi:hypothetical protein